MKIQKPVITAPTITDAGSLEGSGANLTGSFSGAFDASSFASDGLGIVSASAQTVAHLAGTNTVSGSAQTVANLAGTSIVSGSAQTVSNLAGTSIVSGSSIASSAQGEVALTTNGVAATAVDLGLKTDDDVTFASVTTTGNVTIAGDLNVTGDTIQAQVTNLNVEDKFILINSGSGAADGGIVVNGAGAALGWDNSEGRWSLDSAGALANQTAISTDAFIAGVVDIDAGHSDIAAYQKNGNITVKHKCHKKSMQRVLNKK